MRLDKFVSDSNLFQGEKKMRSVKGIYDGKNVKLLEDVKLPKNNQYKVIISFIEEEKIEEKPLSSQSEVELIAKKQGCSVETAQRILDMQGKWKNDKEVIEKILSIREELNKWQPSHW